MSKIDEYDITYNDAGGLSQDKYYDYEYDYENRIVEITKDQDTITIAEFSYVEDPTFLRRNALGRRIRKYDAITETETLYYYSSNWSRKGRIRTQVLEERDGSDNLRQWFAYGNYIDEVLFKNTASTGTGSCHMYLQDHLYSTVALLDVDGAAVERYEYDAYGNPYIFTSNDGVWFNGNDEYWDYSVNYGNPYLFTGREYDALDSNSLKIQYNRNRSYDYYTGRWLTQDPAGYVDGMNLYEYVKSNPIDLTDPLGLLGCRCRAPDKFKKPCKCFCITSFTLTGKKSSTADEPFVGAHLTLTVKGVWVDWNIPDKEMEGAHVEWWEWYDPKPTRHKKLYEGKPIGQWHKILEWKGTVPTSPDYNKWEYSDDPGVTLSKTIPFNVEDKFAVRGKNPDKCPCPKGSRTKFKAFGYLKIVGTKSSVGGYELKEHEYMPGYVPDKPDWPAW